MGRQNYSKYRRELSVDQLIKENYAAFEQLPDPRNRVINSTMADVCQSAFAMFHLKFPSLLDFDTATVAQKDNLSSVYNIKQACSDTQMRRLLDPIEGRVIHQRLVDIVNVHAQRSGVLKQFCVFTDRLAVSLDGVEHFRSSKVKCDHCLSKQSKGQPRQYYHQMLCGSLVHPDHRQVLPVVAEPIIRQDGERKNDCERNAAQRVITRLGADYGDHKLLVLADGLYSCGPVIKALREGGHQFIITVKPGDHKSLFTHFAARSERKQTRKLTIKSQGIEHQFEWANNLPLNGSWANLRLNMLKYRQIDPKGESLTFSWVTDRPLRANTVERVMRCGRSRWKIENETFNTLKNQGYNFAHNYGHGKDQLSTVLAYLMLLAFSIDQLIEICSQQFQAIVKQARTRVKVWFQQRALFTTDRWDDFAGIYGRLAELFGVQLI